MAEMCLLAVETSQRPGGVALAVGDAAPVGRPLTADRANAAELFPAIEQLLREAGRRLLDVTVLAYSCGPGSFTGLRVAATLGRMLQSTVGCRVVAVPTLEVIARNALAHPQRPRRLAVMLDARRGQVFGGLFERLGEELVTLVPAGLFEPQAWLRELGSPLWVLGAGVGSIAAAIVAGATVLEESYWPARAEQVAAIGVRLAAAGRFCSPEQIVPLYIRPPECEEVYERRRAAARERRGE